MGFMEKFIKYKKLKMDIIMQLKKLIKLKICY